MTLLPKEHGAYGQLAFPQLTALTAVGVSVSSGLWTVAMIAAFLGHEPLLVLLGRRGTRRRREEFRSAARVIGVIAAIGMMAGGAALWTAPPHTRWSFVVPLLPTLIALIAIARDSEKTTMGEVAVATTFAFAAVPLAITAGASAQVALAIAIAYWMVFVSATFAVRIVILRVRGGGNPAAVRKTRGALAALEVVACIAVAIAIGEELLPTVLLVAVAPPLLMSMVIAAFPPPPTRLRHVGWSMVAATLVTAIVLIAGLDAR